MVGMMGCIIPPRFSTKRMEVYFGASVGEKCRLYAKKKTNPIIRGHPNLLLWLEKTAEDLSKTKKNMSLFSDFYPKKRNLDTLGAGFSPEKSSSFFSLESNFWGAQK